jgi:Ca2+-binding RTX toxin-like protein
MAPHVRASRPIFKVVRTFDGGRQIIIDTSIAANAGIKIPVIKLAPNFSYANQLLDSLEEYYYNTPSTETTGLIANLAKYADNGWDLYLQMGVAKGSANAAWSYMNEAMGDYGILKRATVPEAVITFSQASADNLAPASLDDFIFGRFAHETADPATHVVTVDPVSGKKYAPLINTGHPNIDLADTVNITPALILTDKSYMDEIHASWVAGKEFPNAYAGINSGRDISANLTEAQYLALASQIIAKAYQDFRTEKLAPLQAEDRQMGSIYEIILLKRAQRALSIMEAGGVGSAAGSALGQYLAGGNTVKAIVYSSLLGEIGERLGTALAAGATGDGNLSLATTQGLQAFGNEVAVRAGQAAIGSISSWLSMELGEAIGLKGFGAELFTTAGSYVTTKVIGNLLDATLGSSKIFSGFVTQVTGKGQPTAGPGFAGAIGSFLGTKLGAMVVSPQTQAGVALSSIGSAIGSYLVYAEWGSKLGNFFAPGIGAFVGFVLGALIGNLFGKKKPKTPTASAETVLQIPYAQYQLGAITVANNGNRDLVTSMATTARDTLNGLIAMVAYTNTTAYVSNLNGYGTTQTYGHSGEQIYVKINGVQSNFTSADQAVEYGTLTAIRNTKIVGGDIFAKRVIAKSPAADLVSLTGDLQVAADYRTYVGSRDLVNSYIIDAYASLTQAEQNYYAANKALIDKRQVQGAAALSGGELAIYNANKALIDKITASLESQVAANPWIITLERASELGLDKWSVSDFYGGLQGFLGSFNLGAHGTAFENVRVMAQGGGAEIQARYETSAGIFSLLPQAIDGLSDNDVLNARFQGGMQGWDMAAWNVATPQRGVNLTDWSGSGNDSYYVYMPGTPAAGAVIDTRSDWIITAAGVTYETAVKAAQHRGQASAFVEFYDANRNVIGYSFLSGAATESGSYHGDLSTYGQLSGTAVAPAGTVYRRVVLRLTAIGGETPFGFFTQPTSRQYTGATLNWQTAGEAVRIEDLSQVGYGVRALGGQTSGNDLIDQRLATSGVTIDDSHTEVVWQDNWQYDPYEGGWYNVPTEDVIQTQGGDDIFVGGQYNDVLYGRDGWDWLDGRAGDDWIEGGAGNDVLIGRNGNDVLQGGDGDDYIAAGDGADSVYGGGGNDILVDGTGSECLQGDDGDDTFLIAADSVFNWMWGGSQDFNSDPNGSDTLSAERLTFGVRFDLDFRPPEWNGAADVLAGDSRARAAIVTDLATGAWIASEGLIGIENATGSAFNDQLYGTTGGNALKGLAGDDQLYGQDGNDVLEGGVGADSLHGGNGVDTLSYADSTLGVYVNLTTHEVLGGDANGDVFDGVESVRGSKFSDELKGDAGANRLEGGAGDDWLIATAGADVYNGGDGQDFVDYSEAAEGVYLVLSAYTPTFQYDGSGYSGLAAGHSYNNVEGVAGSAFTDFLYGGEGDQTFIGGVGSDYLAGGAGADTYVISRGDGYDTITEDNTGWNVVSFGENVKYSDLWGGTAGGANGWLDLGIRGDNAQFRITSNFGAYPTAGNNKVKSIDLNGLSQLDIGGLTFGVASDDTSQTLVGSKDTADLILGYNGDDVIWGAQSSYIDNYGNVVIGGLGVDQIHTSNGDDQFGYDRGDGLDTIDDTGGLDTLALGPTVAAEDVIFEVVGSDLYIGARNLSNTAQTASQVADRVKIIGGGVQWVETDPYGTPMGGAFYNTVEYVLAGGDTIDLRKLDINWTVQTYVNYSNYYPIALDLDGDGLDMLTVEASSVVVKTAQGGLSKIGWVGPADGFLAVDRNGDGAINQLSELSFVQDKAGATSDLEGLRTWDTNNDGVLDTRDANFSRLLLFVDANQNGRSTAKELRTLEEAGIKAINLGGVASGYTADMTTESFVQNTISFVWADGREGAGYDVALARRVLGSEGLYAGDYQAEWGSQDEDGMLGQLANDPKTLAKAARIRANRGLLDRLSASYDEVKAAAQLDFSDHDRIDATIAKRWTKMSASDRAAWLSGQGDGLNTTSQRLRALSSEQAWANTVNEGVQARQTLVDQGFQLAGATISRPLISRDASDRAAGLSQNLQSASTPDAGLQGLAAGEPLDGVLRPEDGGGEATAWWRGETVSGLNGAGSLAGLLAAMDRGVGAGLADEGQNRSDPALLRQQLLLRQAMAGFGGEAGGSAAVWNRETLGASAVLAASQPATPVMVRSPALAL